MSLRRCLGVLVMVLCIGVPIAETFDRWDNTLRDGNDTESNLVIAAICVGFALTLFTTLGPLIRALRATGRISSIRSSSALSTMHPLDCPVPTISPPIPLRI